jgi:hypothetical protein
MIDCIRSRQSVRRESEPASWMLAVTLSATLAINEVCISCIRLPQDLASIPRLTFDHGCASCSAQFHRSAIRKVPLFRYLLPNFLSTDSRLGKFGGSVECTGPAEEEYA